MFKGLTRSPDTGDAGGGSVGGVESQASVGNAQGNSGNGLAIPQGHRLVRDDEWAASMKWREQVGGFSKTQEALKKHNLDLNALDDDTLALIAKSRSSREYNPKFLVDHLFGENGLQQERQQEPAKLTNADIERLVEERASALMDKKFSERDLRSRHENEFKSMLEAEKAALKEVMEQLGVAEHPDETDLQGQLLRYALLGYQASSYKDQFDDDHTLKGQFMPLNPQFIKGDFLNKFKSMRESLSASEQIDMAKRAASGGVRSTAAGKGTGQPESVPKNNIPTPTGITHDMKKQAADFLEKRSKAGGVVSAV